MTKKTALQRAAASKIGRHCYFTNPDTKEVIEGTYKRGRKVVQLTRITPPKNTTGPRTYMIDETIWTVPRHIPISFGQPPRKD